MIVRSENALAGVRAVEFDTAHGLPPVESSVTARDIAREFVRDGDLATARYWIGYAVAAERWEMENL